MIELVDKGNWTYIINNSAEENLIEIQEEITKPFHGSMGKYQFFSDDKEILIKLAKEILIKYCLFNAKVPLGNTPRKTNKGFGFGLFIYDSKPKLKIELRNYADEKTIRHRYWKSDDDTLKGKYSNKFIESLSSTERKELIERGV